MMNPEDLNLLVDRLLDDELIADERAALAQQLSNDPAFHQQFANELALSLQIRATLATDADHRADLLMATLSGSRSIKVEQHIIRAVQNDSRSVQSRPWLLWSSGAVAALLLIMVSAWWLGHTNRAVHSTTITDSATLKNNGSDQSTATPLTEPPTKATANLDEATSASIIAAQQPTESVETLKVGEEIETEKTPSPSTVLATQTQDPDNQNNEKSTDVTPPTTIVIVNQSPENEPAQPPTVLTSATELALAKNMPVQTPKTTQRPGPQLIMSSGQAHLRRRDRESTIGANTRLLPGDDINVEADNSTTLIDERGITWQCGPYTRLSINQSSVVDAPQQPISLSFGTLHITAGLGLRPQITTPHIRIDTEAADLWITVTSTWTRVETMDGSVRLGTNVKRPLASGFYALVLPGDPPAIYPVGQGRLAVINGRFTRDGHLIIPRILRGVSVPIAAAANATALFAPLNNELWLDQAASLHLNAFVDVPKNIPSTRVLKHPALSAWVANNDVRSAIAIRRADPQRPLHLTQSAPARLAAWASSCELVEDDDCGSERATLAVVAVNAQVQANTWHALVRGTQGVIWTVNDGSDPGTTLRPLTTTLEATQHLLTDGARERLDLGADLSAARWDCPDQRLVVVVNRGSETRSIQVPHARGLSPFAHDETITVEQQRELTAATLPPGSVLMLMGTTP